MIDRKITAIFTIDFPEGLFSLTKTREIGKLAKQKQKYRN